MHRVSPCQKRKSASPVLNVLTVDPEYCLLSEERNPVQLIPQQILVSLRLGEPPRATGPAETLLTSLTRKYFCHGYYTYFFETNL